ncbi:hypothetical protein E4U33_002930 [Claviceps sp. LM78 group G4]|nr:hypothetical protein E4U33_002930 [Claviceps sp. LM78 group G4]
MSSASAFAICADFIAYFDTMDDTTVGEARYQLRQMRQRPNESFTEFLVRFESQMAKADALDMSDIDKVDLLQIAIQAGFDKRCNRNSDIPVDNYAAAVLLRVQIVEG